MVWQPSATIENLKLRAQILANVRSFFANLGYLEVDTPIMGQHGISDVYLENIRAKFRGHEYYLQTSPEYHMKRLLAAGSGPIYQIFRAFRDDELGRWHNPEFSLLEWYKLSADYNFLIAEVDDFLQKIFNCEPALKISYRQIFIEACGVDPFAVDVHDLRLCLQRYDLDNVLDIDEQDIDQYLFLLMSHVVEPFMANYTMPVVVYGFPKSQAALAKVVDNVALRFEVYYKGVELANGFAELTDADAQRMRFIEDNFNRVAKDLKTVTLDENFLQSLKAGLPECSGVALGLDRIIALYLQQNNLASVISFVIDRA